ncbi:MAG: hypothetical protein H6R17_1233 [Proteobacteria bacterium]|nr:hypothetical protein [Pseudomonadota bacterium]
MNKNAPMPRREKRYFKEIGWLLLIKICLIVALRIAFFSPPEVKAGGTAQTAAHLLGATRAAEPATSYSENRSSYDQ